MCWDMLQPCSPKHSTNEINNRFPETVTQYKHLKFTDKDL